VWPVINEMLYLQIGTLVLPLLNEEDLVYHLFLLHLVKKLFPKTESHSTIEVNYPDHVTDKHFFFFPCRLMRLWRLIYDSHHKQLQAVLESKPDRLIPEKHFGTSTSGPSIQLELELINWSSSFSNWIQAQNSYVHTLNQYLLKWLPQYKEDTTNSSCSPMSIGAPPVFVLSNDWAHMAEKVSEFDVIDKMQVFALSVHLLLERQHKLRADHLSDNFAKRMGHLNSGLGLEEGDNMLDGKIMAIEELKKRLDLDNVKNKDATKLIREACRGNLKAGLGPIFKALEGFSMEILRGFEEVRFPISGNP
jgi:Protein of unknown function (DUF632)